MPVQINNFLEEEIFQIKMHNELHNKLHFWDKVLIVDFQLYTVIVY